MNNPIFAIITDFGFDFSVASMKALILRNFPDALARTPNFEHQSCI